jgi:hypothetical protein
MPDELQTPAEPSQEPAADVTPKVETPEVTPEVKTEVAPAQPTTPQEKTAEPGDKPPVERVVPEVDGYKLPEGIPAEVKQFAKDNEFTQAQLDATLTKFGGMLQSSKEAEAVALRELGEAQLEKWGDNAKTNLSLAKKALAQNDPDGSLTKALNASGWGNHPAVLTFLYNIGKSMQEGGYLKSAVNRPAGQKTLAQTMYGDGHPSNS